MHPTGHHHSEPTYQHQGIAHYTLYWYSSPEWVNAAVHVKTSTDSEITKGPVHGTSPSVLVFNKFNQISISQ